MPKRFVETAKRARSIIVQRNDRMLARDAFPQPQLELANHEYEEAPRPPIDSRFAGFGRDTGHAPTPIRTYGGGLAIADWQSVAAWPFSIAKIPSAMVVNTAHMGRMNPMRERQNIVSPSQVTLGDQHALDGRSYIPDYLGKIS